MKKLAFNFFYFFLLFFYVTSAKQVFVPVRESERAWWELVWDDKCCINALKGRGRRGGQVKVQKRGRRGQKAEAGALGVQGARRASQRLRGAAPRLFRHATKRCEAPRASHWLLMAHGPPSWGEQPMAPLCWAGGEKVGSSPQRTQLFCAA